MGKRCKRSEQDREPTTVCVVAKAVGCLGTAATAGGGKRTKNGQWCGDAAGGKAAHSAGVRVFMDRA